MVYLDDLIIRSETFDQHLSSVAKVLDALEANGFKLKPGKTKLCRESVQLLVHLIDPEGIQPIDKNLSGVLKKFSTTNNCKTITVFLGYGEFLSKTFLIVQ